MQHTFGETPRHYVSGTSISIRWRSLLEAASILALLILLFPLAACDEYAPEAKLLRTVPAQQKKLAAIVKTSKDEYLEKFRGEDKDSVVDNRVKLLKERFEQKPVAKGWLGRLSEIARTAEGNLILKINCGPFLVSNRVALKKDAPGAPTTEIRKSSPLYGEISKLNAGDCVQFDGAFISDTQARIVELSLTEEGAMIHPDFLMRFTRVAKCSLPSYAGPSVSASVEWN